MTAAEVVGAGAVAQLVCRDLRDKGCAVHLMVPQGGRTKQEQRERIAELKARAWLEGIRVSSAAADTTSRHAAPRGLRLFAGTVEQWFDAQDSSNQPSEEAPVLLLTSWWKPLSHLQKRLRRGVVPVYPRTTVESWDGRLAVLGGLQLELPSEEIPGLDRGWLRHQLEHLGLSWVERPMQARFQALFARTRFAYWYILECLDPRRRGEPGASPETTLERWQQVEPLLAPETDLQIPLEMLELALSVMRNGDPTLSDAAWILKVLVEHKRPKIDYFLQRQGELP
jgi:hypothetical protein